MGIGRKPIIAGRNAIKDVTPFIKRDGIDLSEYYKTAVDCFRYKGNLYALPVDFMTVALYYNKTMFNKENLSYPDESWGWKDRPVGIVVSKRG